MQEYFDILWNPGRKDEDFYLYRMEQETCEPWKIIEGEVSASTTEDKREVQAMSLNEGWEDRQVVWIPALPVTESCPLLTIRARNPSTSCYTSDTPVLSLNFETNSWFITLSNKSNIFFG